MNRAAIVAFRVASRLLVRDVDVVIVNDTATTAVSEAVGIGVGCGDGASDGSFVGGNVGSFDGTSVGIAVGTNVGTGVGGLVYSTTMVDVVTVELAVAFLLAVMLTPVTFALAVTRAVVRLPLLAADDMPVLKALVRLAALPLYSVARRRPSLSSFVRATIPSRRTSSVKCTSTSVTFPAAFATAQKGARGGGGV